MKTYRIINLIEVILGIIFFLYFFACVIYAGLKINIIYVWVLMGAVLIPKGIVWLKRSDNLPKLIKAAYYVFDGLFAIFLSLLFVFLGFLINDMNAKPVKNADYCVVLGGGLKGERPSAILQRRINAAYDYLIENPDTIAIATGKKADDEIISEASCIKRELIKMGIREERILMEEKSAKTLENFQYALELMDEPQSIVVVSNGFHLFRSKMILRNLTDVSVSGMPGKSDSILTPHYCFREFISFSIDVLSGNYQIK